MDGPRDAETIADIEGDGGQGHKLSSIGRYVILDSVGMGGMGLVCAAYDPKLNRKVALKLLRNAADEATTTAGRSRLFREAQALARLSHPNVVTVHDVDVFEQQVYIAMEFVEGTTLREWLKAGPRTWKQIVEKFILAGRGLAAAHEADIIHRDFKPSNVLISKDGDVRVADFGVAKERGPDRDRRPDVDGELERRRRTTTGGGSIESTSEDALIEEIQSNVSLELTVAGRMVGTPAYMAPEQHLGLHVGPFTDQYSFCVSLYEALYGRLPFEGTDRRDQLARMAEGKLPPPPKDGPVRKVPGWVHKAIARGLRPHPSERWPSMDALLDALARDPIKRARRIAAIVAVALGVGVGVFGLLWDDDEDVSHCPALAHDVEQHWNPTLRDEIERAFLASPRPYAADSLRRVSQTLDTWAANWSRTRVDVCEATRVGGQSEALLDLRMHCLDQRAREFDAMVRLFVEADEGVLERSVSAAHDIADARACASVRESGDMPLRELDEAAREQIVEMEAELSRALALRAAQKYGESLPLQARVVARARALPHTPTLVRALYELSESQFETGDTAGGEASLREAIELAAKLDDPVQEVEAWGRLIFYVGSKHKRFPEGHAWSLAASSALVRASSPAELSVRHESTLGALDLAEGDAESAARHYERALGLARETVGEDHPLTIRMLTNYGVALARLDGEAAEAEAEAVMLEAVARSKTVYGPAHPWLATVYLNLGSAYYVREQFEKAEAAFREALAIRERVGGPEAPNLAGPLQMLAKIEVRREHYREALTTLERVLAIQIALKGETSAEVAGVVTDIATTQTKLGRFDDARASFERVAAIYTELYPDGHPHIAGLEKRRCTMFIAAAQWAEAVDACERALAINERFETELDVQLEVAELLLAAETGRGRTAAVERLQQRVIELRLLQTHAKSAVNR